MYSELFEQMHAVPAMCNHTCAVVIKREGSLALGAQQGLQMQMDLHALPLAKCVLFSVEISSVTAMGGCNLLISH